MPINYKRVRRPGESAIKKLLPQTQKQADMSQAIVLNKTVKQVQKISKTLKAELRFLDAQTAVAAASTTGIVLPLNLMVVGDNNGTREGTVISNKSLKVRYHIYANGTSQVANVRLIWVYDKQTNAALPVVNDLLMSTDPESFRNQNNKNRFVILKDVTKAIGINNEPKRGVFSINLKGKQTNYNTTNGGTIADIVSGALLLFYMSDVAAANAPTVDIHNRLWYSA